MKRMRVTFYRQTNVYRSPADDGGGVPTATGLTALDATAQLVAVVRDDWRSSWECGGERDAVGRLRGRVSLARDGAGPWPQPLKGCQPCQEVILAVWL